MTVFNVCRFAPPGYRHAAAFDEVVETLQAGIEALGHQVRVAHNEFPRDGVNIVIGSHLMDPTMASTLTPATVVYNLEQIDLETRWQRPERLDALRHTMVWDYSTRNLEYIASFTGNRRLAHVPIGYVPQLTRIVPADHQDIDVLFYGSMNERRQRVMTEISARGLNVRTAFGVYGAERDRLIARARVVLNLHYYRAQVFEIVRVSYLLANHKAVVSECDDQTTVDSDLRDAMWLSPYEGLAAACETLVRDEELRHRVEHTGFRRIADRKAVDLLRAPLAAACERLQ